MIIGRSFRLFNRISNYHFLVIYLLHLLWLLVSLCSGYSLITNAAWICIDSMIIYGQSNFPSQELGNILFILANIWYPIQFMYIWDTIYIFFQMLTRNWNVLKQNFTRVFHGIISWTYSVMKLIWHFRLFTMHDTLLYTQYMIYY